MCLIVLPECVYLYYVYAWCPQKKSKESIRATGTGIMDGFEALCVCWETNPGPWQEHQVLLMSEPSLQPPFLNS